MVPAGESQGQSNGEPSKVPRPGARGVEQSGDEGNFSGTSTER